MSSPLEVRWKRKLITAQAVATSPYKDGDAVLVLGSGPIGLSVILALLAKGCKQIIVSEVGSHF